MKYVFLDGERIDDKAALHRILAAQLGFPDWYGRNLDALYDLLSEPGEPCCLILRHPEAFEEKLGGYYRCFLNLLEDLRDQGSRVTLDLPAPRD